MLSLVFKTPLICRHQESIKTNSKIKGLTEMWKVKAAYEYEMVGSSSSDLATVKGLLQMFHFILILG
jgi:hypothetical protein